MAVCINKIPSVASIPSPWACQNKVDKLSDFFKFIFIPIDWIIPINPVTNCREIKLIPSIIEKAIGAGSYPGLVLNSGGEIGVENKKYGYYARLVKEVGALLADKCPRKDLSFEFKLLQSSSDNAWCLPGGKIGINLGLVEKMDRDWNDYGLGYRPTLKEKIGAVLGHEITHAAARHGGRKIEFCFFSIAVLEAIKYACSFCINKQYDVKINFVKNDPVKKASLIRKKHQTLRDFSFLFSKISKYALPSLNLCGSRRHELEADKYGMHLCAEVQDGSFNKNAPKASIWLMHFFQKHHSRKTGLAWVDWARELFHTHPSPEERLEANIKTWDILKRMSP